MREPRQVPAQPARLGEEALREEHAAAERHRDQRAELREHGEAQERAEQRVLAEAPLPAPEHADRPPERRGRERRHQDLVRDHLVEEEAHRQGRAEDEAAEHEPGAVGQELPQREQDEQGLERARRETQPAEPVHRGLERAGEAAELQPAGREQVVEGRLIQLPALVGERQAPLLEHDADVDLMRGRVEAPGAVEPAVVLEEHEPGGAHDQPGGDGPARREPREAAPPERKGERARERAAEREEGGDIAGARPEHVARPRILEIEERRIRRRARPAGERHARKARGGVLGTHQRRGPALVARDPEAFALEQEPERRRAEARADLHLDDVLAGAEQRRDVALPPLLPARPVERRERHARAIDRDRALPVEAERQKRALRRPLEREAPREGPLELALRPHREGRDRIRDPLGGRLVREERGRVVARRLPVPEQERGAHRDEEEQRRPGLRSFPDAHRAAILAPAACRGVADSRRV